MGMPKYDRMMYILNSLRSRRNLSANRLAEECGVTERSIYRDILSLSEANVPIYYDHGYKLASDNFLPPLNFDFDEYSCLRLALESTPLVKIEKYESLIKKIRAKVEAGLSDNVLNRQRFSQSQTSIEIPVTNSNSSYEHFNDIEQASLNDFCISISYDSISSGNSERTVDPYFIVFRNKSFYFVAFCHKSKDFRTFRLDRISKLQVTDTHFVRKNGVSSESYFNGSWGVYSGERISVTILFKGSAAKVVLSEQHHPDEQVEKVKDGNVRYKITTRGLEEIQRWILTFGDEAEVVEPEELRENLLKVGKSLLSKYS